MAESLADARSPFLQHGAKQPVKWLPWGDLAFERAKREDKAILLDIGAVWCHWCHVMDRESYEDPETAALINELFVPVKVDRDERPDVDARYQRAVQTLTGQGGWPLTAFLTPDGDTFFGGTYFPPTDQYGRPSFRRVLSEVARIWRSERSRAQEAVGGIRDRLAQYASAEVQSGELTPALVHNTVEAFAEAYDFRFGGFGRAPKFPNPGGLQLLLDFYLDSDEDWCRRMVVETLDAMAGGGIYDQLGGGFHRYSTDARWLIPHFEKMAYDNGPLLEVYARAAAVFDSELYREITHGIVEHYEDIAGDLLRAGGFPASQDADITDSDDGDYWTWTHAELRATLTTEEYERAVKMFGIEDAGTAMHLDPNRHVLYRAQDMHEGIRRKLKQQRDQRPRPYVDETLYTGWTALVASGFIAAARYTAHARALAHAQRALDRIWAEAFDAQRGLAHRVGDREAGEYLEDHAFTAQALLDLFEVTQDTQQLERAQQIVDVANRRFRESSGVYRDRPVDVPATTGTLNEPHYPITDSPTPSGNGTMALVLLRLGRTAEAQRVLSAFAASAARLDTAAATYMRAADRLIAPASTLVVVTATASDDELWQAALSSYRPRTLLRRYAATDVKTDELPVELQAMVSSEAPRAYLCAGRSCAAPVSDAAALRQLMREFRGG
ncbi:MAG TPA: thioredoxin domain-containing protein [Longimicrobiales bacterium]|nr:thioredoxin domain-containing protein [Longimicrobiales bacterium]